jgi:hypothetical protein
LRGHWVNQGLQDLISVFAPTSSADALTAWIEVLQATNRAALPCLFPNANEGLGGI